mmetsp:Transcript_26568/g.59964  ORF Transcript_26568/g.59964 Transcript_26568/m.59964 type:complete len:505 (+) Transcript_26568:257-1771(+)
MAREILDKTQWLSQLSSEFKDEIAKLMSPLDLVEGTILIREGTPQDTFYLVDSGVLVRAKNVPDSAETIDLDTIGPAATSGFLHVAGVEDDDVAFATITAGKGGCRCYAAKGDEFRALCVNPTFSAQLISVLTKVVRTATKVVRATVSTGSGSGVDLHTSNSSVFKVLCYDTTQWVTDNFTPQIEKYNDNEGGMNIKMDFTQDRLSEGTAKFAAGYDAVCLFVNDTADSNAIRILSLCGVKMIAMRCAGFDRVDVQTAKALGISIARVPAYSPYAVAEHAIALLMSVNRKIAQANQRVKMADFTLDSSLLGIDIHGKNVGVMGTGKIGQILCTIVKGFGANLYAYDVFENEDVKAMGGQYVSSDTIYEKCDVIFLMMPLLAPTKHTINKTMLHKLKKGVILINTSRGGLIDTGALVEGLSKGIFGGVGLDVYENESDYFFQDWSAKAINDNQLVQLLGNNRVVMTPHQAFFTKEAIDKIVSTTVENLDNFCSGLRGGELPNSIC